MILHKVALLVSYLAFVVRGRRVKDPVAMSQSSSPNLDIAHNSHSRDEEGHSQSSNPLAALAMLFVTYHSASASFNVISGRLRCQLHPHVLSRCSCHGCSAPTMTSNGELIEETKKPDTSTATTFGMSMSDIDPLIGRVLRSGALSADTNLMEWHECAAGLSVWRRALTAGRVPDWGGIDADSLKWPPEPMRSALSNMMVRLSLPRVTARHPSVIPAALTAVLNSVVRFKDETKHMTPAHLEEESLEELVSANQQDDFEVQEHERQGNYEEDDNLDMQDEQDEDVEGEPVIPEAMREAAEWIATSFAMDWEPSVRGIRSIEALGGAEGGDAGSITAPLKGDSFCPADGLWHHRGWDEWEALQSQLRQFQELSSMIASLGQRASTEGVPQRGPSALKDDRAAPSAALSEIAPRELSGLSRTGNLARVAPFEFSLLADKKGPSANMKRRLFLSRFAERQLLGYSLEGWAEETGRPQPHRPQRLPRSRCGPLVVCLDTSSSMNGGRERLSKAVVLEVVRSAHAQGRPCLVFAFSGTHNLAELRLVPPSKRLKRSRGRRKGSSVMDRASLTKLLDFLACSFGAGTDVISPMRRAIEVLEQPDQADVVYTGADMLLVSDGELPNPPLDPDTQERLQRLKDAQGFMVHGLLIREEGREMAFNETLSQMCDQMHTFLSRFDPMNVLRNLASNRAPTTSFTTAARKSRSRQLVMSDSAWGSHGAEPISALAAGTNGSLVNSLTAVHGWRTSSINSPKVFAPVSRSRQLVMSEGKPTVTVSPEPKNDLANAEQRTKTKKEDDVRFYDRAALQMAAKLAEVKKAKVKTLSNEDFHEQSLRSVITALEYGLIERQGEARLLMLALVGGEHLLLLGPPGTAKSELCRRLSTIASLTYFERTLTRFSSPEELFGPLSLSALERDEFKRATTGYAPDAQIVFIDEIFKSNSAILNTLLTLLNERLFDDGSARRKVPLLSAIAASNEGPESDELDALYDRFLLRKVVSPVSDDGVLELLLDSPPEELGGNDTDQPIAPPASLDTSTLRDSMLTVKRLASNVILPRWTALLLRDARSHVRDTGIDGGGGGYVSDRRLRRAADLLKACAAAHGRNSVSVVDALAVLPHVLWDDPEEAVSLSEWIEDHVLPDGGVEQLRYLLESVRARTEQHAAAIREASKGRGDRTLDAALVGDVRALSAAAVEAAAEMHAHQAALESASEHLFLPPEQAAGVRQRLLPEAKSIAAELEKLAVLAITVELFVVEGGTDPEVMYDGAPLQEKEKQPKEEFAFSDEELSMGRKEAKAKLDPDEFRAWKKAVEKMKQHERKSAKSKRQKR